MTRAYLDHNATSPLRPAVRDAMLDAYGTIGNPSSVHREGRAARALVEAARAKVADLVGAKAGHVILTSGASEANMLALGKGMKEEFQPASASHLFISAIEHPSVLSGGRFSVRERSEIPVDRAGVIDLGALRARLDDHDRRHGRALIAVMAVNSETGVIQPIAEIAELAQVYDAYFHLDAVQAAGRIPFDIETLGCTSLSLSAHKLGGPQGVGALVMAAEGLEPEPLLTGGPQEHRLRAGTENVAGIVGFGEACVLAKDALSGENGIAIQTKLRNAFEARLTEIAPEVEIFGAAASRVGNTCQFVVPGLKGETVLIQLDLAGVAVSSGSACSSGKVSASHVLSAMGYDAELASGAIRMSLGWSSSEADVEHLLGALEKICAKYSRKAG
ncbi:cysteine desulfurase [Cohaesibacter sp. ES.047]|uniref:cysteine desulfurase family protein n=1 Tax=Cohaesibacter sp. ES.047 TaxID=1798205 RepID=UPI000BBFAEC0|nr:cysteine desulfurase family protein [Cohaesibacter sp. ES.047]SNY93774.1 cysteine desulfurase [Cohaesibacter sp. ES.047]